MVKLQPQTGVAYIGVLLLVAVISISMTIVSQNEDTQIKRQKEQDWLFIGNQYRLAIASYYNKSPNGIKILPTKLDELLLDNRFVSPVRHLRRIYGDPLNHEQNWSLIKNQDDKIIGVYSESQETFLSRKRIAEVVENFDSQNAHYADIQFIFLPKQGSENTESELKSEENNETVNSDSQESTKINEMD